MTSEPARCRCERAWSWVRVSVVWNKKQSAPSERTRRANVSSGAPWSRSDARAISGSAAPVHPQGRGALTAWPRPCIERRTAPPLGSVAHRRRHGQSRARRYLPCGVPLEVRSPPPVDTRDSPKRSSHVREPHSPGDRQRSRNSRVAAPLARRLAPTSPAPITSAPAPSPPSRSSGLPAGPPRRSDPTTSRRSVPSASKEAPRAAQTERTLPARS